MIVERIRQIIEYKGQSERAFCREIGASHGYLDKVKNVGADKLESILQMNPWVNGHWLITGEGSMKNPETGQGDQMESSAKPVVVASGKGVPYYDVDFIGGFDLVFENQTANPAFYIDFPPFNDADCWVNVTGKSMAPSISHGDIVALKRMETWKDFLLFGEVYAIITEEYRTIKKLSAGQDDKHFTLVPDSESDEFSRQPIPIAMINHIFQVKGAIKKFF